MTKQIYTSLTMQSDKELLIASLRICIFSLNQPISLNAEKQIINNILVRLRLFFQAEPGDCIADALRLINELPPLTPYIRQVIKESYQQHSERLENLLILK